MTKMTFLDSCESYFQTRNLYDVLLITKDANPNELKRAYHKLSLKVHPDRVLEKDKKTATKKFQTLGRVYSVLSDEERRKMYDETGAIDDDDMLSEDVDWDSLWKSMFKKVTIEDIKTFEKQYKDSEEELDDLKAAYLSSKGDMSTMLSTVLCSSIDDEERFRGILDNLIESEELPAYKKFTHETPKKREKRKKRAQEEAEEADEFKKKIGLDDSEDSLKQLILKRGKEREANMDSFFDSLAAKYGKADEKKKKKSKKSK